MDTLTKTNEQRWDALSQAGILCGQPDLTMNADKARAMLNRDGLLGEVAGKKVLCLASGGGQQSIGFALLGADVTVVDFSDEQLKKDRQAAKRTSLKIEIVRSDMRNLSMFAERSFDIVYQPYSINYIPSVEPLFDEVTRVLKPQGIYHLMFHNPFVHGSWKTGCWEGSWNPHELWQKKGTLCTSSITKVARSKQLIRTGRLRTRQDRLSRSPAPKNSNIPSLPCSMG